MRWYVPIGVGAVLAVATLASMGLDARSELTVSEARPAEGDVLLYSLHSDDVDTLVQLDWGGLAPLTLLDGSTRDLQVVTGTRWDDEKYQQRTFFLNAGGSLVAATHAFKSDFSRFEVDLMDGGLTWRPNPRLAVLRNNFVATQTSHTTFFEPADVCEVVLPSEAAGPVLCDGFSLVHATASPTILGMQPITAEFRPGFPYFVRATTPQGMAMELRAYERGDAAPRIPEDAQGVVPLRRLALADTTSRGPDESAFHQEYPLQNAYRIATGQNCYLGFAEDHRGTYLAAAQSHIIETNESRRIGWTLVFSDGGSDNLDFYIETSDTTLGQTQGKLTTGEEYPKTYCQPFEDPVIRPNSGVLRSPKVNDLAKEYRHLSRGQAATTWGFSLTCGVDCATPRIDLWAGETILKTVDGPLHGIVDPAGSSSEGSIRLVGTDETGVVSQIMVSQQAGSSAWVPRQPEAAPAARIAWIPAPGGAGPEKWLALSAAGIGVRWLVKVLVGAWLHTRLVRNRLLENPLRLRLVEIVEQNPGAHYRELSRLTSMPPGTLAHHLQILEKAKLLRRVAYRGFTCYFIPDVGPDLIGGVPALKSGVARWIMAEVKRRPGVTARMLATDRNVQPSSILHHVRRLVEAGLIFRTRTRAGLELKATSRAEGLQLESDGPPAPVATE